MLICNINNIIPRSWCTDSINYATHTIHGSYDLRRAQITLFVKWRTHTMQSCQSHDPQRAWMIHGVHRFHHARITMNDTIMMHRSRHLWRKDYAIRIWSLYDPQYCRFPERLLADAAAYHPHDVTALSHHGKGAESNGAVLLDNNVISKILFQKHVTFYSLLKIEILFW